MPDGVPMTLHCPVCHDASSHTQEEHTLSESSSTHSLKSARRKEAKGILRVLPCGHYFCLPCLQEWCAQIHTEQTCPSCKIVYLMRTCDLPSPHACLWEVLWDSAEPASKDELSINHLLNKAMLARSKTIKHLREIMAAMSALHTKTDIVKLSGASIGLIGTFCTLLGSALTLTAAGPALMGLPLALGGGALCGGGGFAVGGSLFAESRMRKSFDKITKYFQADHFLSAQILILMGRAVRDPKLASRLNLPFESMISILRLAKVVMVKPCGPIMGLSTPNVSSKGLAYCIAAFVMSATSIPIDLGRLNIALKKQSDALGHRMRSLVDQFDTQLWELLNHLNYSIMELYFLDKEKQAHWQIIAVPRSKLESPEVQKLKRFSVKISAPNLDFMRKVNEDYTSSLATSMTEDDSSPQCRMKNVSFGSTSIINRTSSSAMDIPKRGTLRSVYGSLGHIPACKLIPPTRWGSLPVRMDWNAMASSIEGSPSRGKRKTPSPPVPNHTFPPLGTYHQHPIPPLSPPVAGIQMPQTPLAKGHISSPAMAMANGRPNVPFPVLNPNPATGSNPNPTTGSNPNPTTGSNPNPTTGSNPNPTTGSNPNPTTGTNPNPTTGTNPNPTTGSNPNPTTGSNPNSITEFDPNPITATPKSNGSGFDAIPGPNPNPTTATPMSKSDPTALASNLNPTSPTYNLSPTTSKPNPTTPISSPTSPSCNSNLDPTSPTSNLSPRTSKPHPTGHIFQSRPPLSIRSLIPIDTESHAHTHSPTPSTPTPSTPTPSTPSAPGQPTNRVRKMGDSIIKKSIPVEPDETALLADFVLVEEVPCDGVMPPELIRQVESNYINLSMRVFVKTPSRKYQVLFSDPNETVESIQQRIASTSPSSARRTLSLYHQGSKLERSQLLGMCGVHDEDTIYYHHDHDGPKD